ncbi:MAG: glycosyltransferase family 2 protein [Verrucomicrobiota bacterium]
MDLSVIIVNWNARDLLRRCLLELHRSALSVNFEVWVVDNGSNDGSVAMVKESFPQVGVLRNDSNFGFARANNQALPHCLGRYLLFLNNDAFVEEGCLQLMVDHLDQHPQCAIAGANLSCSDGRSQWSHGPLPTLRSECLDILGCDQPWRRSGATVVVTGVVSGACLMIRAAVFRELGGFDERFFFYAEEADLCCRVRQAGWAVAHLAQARALHLGGGAGETSARRKLLLYDAKKLYFSKHFGRWKALVLSWALLLTSLLKLILYAAMLMFGGKRVGRVRLWRNVFLGLWSGRRDHLE